MSAEQKQDIARLRTAMNEKDYWFVGDVFYYDEATKQAAIATLKGYDPARLLIGDEISKEGNRHLQWRMKTRKNLRPRAISRALFNSHCQIAWCKAFEYERKECVIIDIDDTHQGARDDLRECMAAALDPKNTWVFLMENWPHVMARNEAFILRYRAEKLYYVGPRVVIWVYGTPGAGKTRLIHDLCPGVSMVRFDNNFCERYDGGQIVVIDDIRPDSLTYTSFLGHLDRYDKSVNVKGHHVHWNAKLIYVTSVLPPTDFYHKHESNLQITRRINHLYCFPQDIDECRVTLQGHLDSLQAPQG